MLLPDLTGQLGGVPVVPDDPASAVRRLPSRPTAPRVVPPLGAHVHVPTGRYRLGEPGHERIVRRRRPFSIGTYPVVTAHLRAWVEATGVALGPAATVRLAIDELADHPATGVTFSEAAAFARWAGERLGVPARLPTGDEWEAAARGRDGRPWPWGPTFDESACACVEALLGSTAPVGAHPAGASPFGAREMAGNVWEWVDEPTEEGAWRAVRGGSYLDHAWGVRSSRTLSADPALATVTTGFRLAFDEPDGMCPGDDPDDVEVER